MKLAAVHVRCCFSARSALAPAAFAQATKAAPQGAAKKDAVPAAAAALRRRRSS